MDHVTKSEKKHTFTSACEGSTTLWGSGTLGNVVSLVPVTPADFRLFLFNNLRFRLEEDVRPLRLIKLFKLIKLSQFFSPCFIQIFIVHTIYFIYLIQTFTIYFFFIDIYQIYLPQIFNIISTVLSLRQVWTEVSVYWLFQALKQHLCSFL